MRRKATLAVTALSIPKLPYSMALSARATATNSLSQRVQMARPTPPLRFRINGPEVENALHLAGEERTRINRKQKSVNCIGNTKRVRCWAK